MTGRAIRFTDRYGVSAREEITLDHLADLLDAISTPDGDDEHRSVSVTDEDEWNLEYYADRVTLENVDEDGEVVGTIRSPGRETELAIAQEFLDGDFEALRRRPWLL